MSGEFRFAEDVRLEGRAEGKVWAGKTVVVGEGAEVDASIEADTLEVFGTVVGDICVARRTTLHKTARVEGEIQTAGIVVEEGARFKGCIVIGQDDASLSGGHTGHAEPPRIAANEPPSLAETRDAKGSGDPNSRRSPRSSLFRSPWPVSSSPMDECAANGYPALAEVDVLPLKLNQFATAHAR